MFAGMFRDGRKGSDYADIVDRGTVRLRTRDQILLIVFTVLGLILALGLPASTVGVVSEIGADGYPLCASTDLSMVPQSVSDDAARSATELFGGHGKKHDRFVDELLAAYVGSQGKDVVVLFSPGGWGCGPMDTARPWGSILSGIQSELSGSSFDAQILTYQRSADSSEGRLEEFMEICRDYASKARILASRVRFLTAHYPDLKVVIAGESTGAIIGAEAMKRLSKCPQVFCIQIGPPFWYRQDLLSRTLIIADNGVVSDAFSHGDLLTIMGANLSAILGRSQTNDRRGTILKYFAAPGHDYWWDYPAVSSQITRFFEENIGIGRADSHYDVIAEEQVAAAPRE